ncbi:MAG: trigger factor [bacterium]
MTHVREDLPKRAVKLTITLTPEELRPYLEKAATVFAEQTPIEGFRPGKAPYDLIKNKVGEMKLLENSLEAIIQYSLWKVVEDEKILMVGNPEINIEKAAPGNPLVYTALLSLRPEVKKLPDLTKLTIAAEPSTFSEKKVSDTLKELQKMQTTEVRVPREAMKNDKIVIDFNMLKNKVSVEGGQAKDHAIYLDEPYYVPGLSDQLIGLKEGDLKSFTLKFPETHYQKHLAGADIDYEINVKGVFELSPPALDDAFANKLGQKDLATMTALISKNIQDESELEASRKTEIKLLETLVEKSDFSEISDRLVKEECGKMYHELEHEVTERGLVFADYLRDIKKTPEQIVKEFEPQAIKRIKIALLLEDLSKNLGIEVTDKELDESLDKIAEGYEDKETKAKVYSVMYREHQKQVLKNTKTIQKLKETLIK